MIKFGNAIRLSALVLAASMASTSVLAQARSAPYDKVSNPEDLSYWDVNAKRPDFAEPFLRDGVVAQPQQFQGVTAGLPASQVQALLGQPLDETEGKRGEEWNYNFKFRLPDSENYLVCQYKVVYDDATETVAETVWRRRQCLNLVNGTL